MRDPGSHRSHFSRADDGVHQARLSIDSDMRFHSKVPLIALLGLMHLGVTLAFLVLGRTRGSNQGGIDHGTALKHEALCTEFVVDDLQDALAQSVGFEQVTGA